MDNHKKSILDAAHNAEKAYVTALNIFDGNRKNEIVRGCQLTYQTLWEMCCDLDLVKRDEDGCAIELL